MSRMNFEIQPLNQHGREVQKVLEKNGNLRIFVWQDVFIYLQFQDEQANFIWQGKANK